MNRHLFGQLFAVIFIILFCMFVLIIGTDAFDARPTANFSTNWEKLDIGMSQEDVTSLLGQPTTSVGPILWSNAKINSDGNDRGIPELQNGLSEALDAKFERWQYGGGIIEAIGQAPRNSHIIYFDENKKVVAFRLPMANVGSNDN